MHRPNWRVLGLGWCVSIALVPRSSAQSNTHVETPEVRTLVWRGVDHVERKDLERSIETQSSTCKTLLFEPFCLISKSPTWVDKHYLNRDEFKRDVLRIKVYYYERGYRAVTVDTSVTPQGKGVVGVTFAITENQPTRVRRLAIEYDSTLISDRQRNKLTLLHVNDPLNLLMLDSMRVLFQRELWDRGYADAVADTAVTTNADETLADVNLRLTTNHRSTVGAITVAGNERVDVATIRNTLTFKPGDLFRASDVLESQRNLYESGLFRQATIVVPLQRDTVKNVEVSVVEAPLHEARVGPGLTNVDFLQFDTRYTSYNLLGGARRLDAALTVGNLLASSLQGRGFFRDLRHDVGDTSDLSRWLLPTWSASLNFTQPWFLRQPANALAIGTFAHRQQNPGVFIDRGYGAQATFTRQLRVRAPVSLNYRYELNRVEASDVYFCVNYGVCDVPTITTLRAHQSLSPLALSAFVDRSDIPFSPTKGYVARFELEHASAITASDYRYNRALFDVAAYDHQSGGHAVYSAHLRAGIVRALTGGVAGIDVLHPRKRFYAGGSQSVRGYTENQLGPRILTISPDQLDSAHVRTATGATGAACDTKTEAVRLCDPNTGSIRDIDFLPQPLGGTSLLEGSVEWRYPIPLPWLIYGKFTGAVFVDGGIVGQSALTSITSLQNIARNGTGAITPGFGVRYESPVGPIRFDVGINPKVKEQLTVVTSIVENGQNRIIPLTTPRTYSPGGGTLLDRLTLHFSIGQAY